MCCSGVPAKRDAEFEDDHKMHLSPISALVFCSQSHSNNQLAKKLHLQGNKEEVNFYPLPPESSHLQQLRLHQSLPCTWSPAPAPGLPLLSKVSLFSTLEALNSTCSDLTENLDSGKPEGKNGIFAALNGAAGSVGCCLGEHTAVRDTSPCSCPHTTDPGTGDSSWTRSTGSSTRPSSASPFAPCLQLPSQPTRELRELLPRTVLHKTLYLLCTSLWQ